MVVTDVRRGAVQEEQDVARVRRVGGQGGRLRQDRRAGLRRQERVGGRHLQRRRVAAEQRRVEDRLVERLDRGRLRIEQLGRDLDVRSQVEAGEAVGNVRL